MPVLTVDDLVQRLRRHPVMIAPMAGGPSTPELAAAASSRGGVGFLAGGMAATDTLMENYRRAMALAHDHTSSPLVGVNLFVPEPVNSSIPEARRAPDSAERLQRAQSVATYRDTLAVEAQARHVELPALSDLDPDDMDSWPEKLEAARHERWPWVTFTFGLPAPTVFDDLHTVGTMVGVTVTDPHEAVAAIRHGADVLIVQGPEAGGHRSVHDPSAAPGTTALVPLLAQVRAAVGTAVPLIAAGGLMDPASIRRVLHAGAAGVQCGTAFLRSPEAGTSTAHRHALSEHVHGTGFPTTALTRAFSGRWARGLANEFMSAHTEAPAAYPEINALTGPLRRAAADAGDVHGVSLWAGSGAAEAREEPAGQILARLNRGLHT